MKRVNSDVYNCDMCGKPVIEDVDEYLADYTGIAKRIPGNALENFDPEQIKVQEMTHLSIPYISYDALGAESQGVENDILLGGSFTVGEQFKVAHKDICKECMEKIRTEYLNKMREVSNWAENVGLIKLQGHINMI